MANTNEDKYAPRVDANRRTRAAKQQYPQPNHQPQQGGTKKGGQKTTKAPNQATKKAQGGKKGAVKKQPVTKKGGGDKRKAPTIESDDEAPVPVAKKPRGRPTKADKAAESEGEGEEEDLAPKTAGKRPGIQTKTKTPAPPADDEDEAGPAPRKRSSSGGEQDSAAKRPKGNDGEPRERETANLESIEADADADVDADNAEEQGGEGQLVDELGAATQSGGIDVGTKGKKTKKKGMGKGKGKVIEAPEEQVDIPRGWIDDLDDSGLRDTTREKEFKDKIKKAQSKFSRDNLPDFQSPTAWKGGYFLGAGAYGASMVYYCENDDGLVIDRIVVKDTLVSNRRQWRDWTRWWGDPRSSDKEHLEIKIMQDIADDARSERCVQLRGSARYDDEYMYRIMMTYCPLGCLTDAIVERPEAGPLEKKDSDWLQTEVYTDSYNTPEPILWKWLEDMAKACQLMEKGVVLRTGSGEPLVPRIIVHRDIKPDNIFLDLPSEVDGDWPGYPIATLGDWGCAFYTHEDDEENPMAYNFWEGTEGFRPIEMQTMLDDTTKRPKKIGVKLGSPTNIWGIGQTFFVICNREPRPKKPNYFSRDTSIPTFNANAQSIYSPELRDLLTRCVQYLPEDRITPSDLLEAIAQHTPGTTDDDLASGMREHASASDNKQTYWEPVSKEHYKVGFAAARWEVKVKRELTQRDKKEKAAARAEAAAARKALKTAAAAAEREEEEEEEEEEQT